MNFCINLSLRNMKTKAGHSSLITSGGGNKAGHGTMYQRHAHTMILRISRGGVGDQILTSPYWPCLTTSPHLSLFSSKFPNWGSWGVVEPTPFSGYYWRYGDSKRGNCNMPHLLVNYIRGCTKCTCFTCSTSYYYEWTSFLKA